MDQGLSLKKHSMFPIFLILFVLTIAGHMGKPDSAFPQVLDVLLQEKTPSAKTHDHSIKGSFPHSLPLTADSALTMNEAIRIGLQEHPLLERSHYASVIAKAHTRQTQGELYPWLEASVSGSSGSLRIVATDGKTIHDQGGHGFDPGGALPKYNQNMITGGLILNQLLTDFGNTSHRILANQATEKATQKELLTQKALVILKVKHAYLNCLMQQSLLKVAESSFQRRKALAKIVQTLHSQQLKDKLDLDLILLKVSETELGIMRAKSDLAQRFAILNNAMGIQGPDHYDLSALKKSPIDMSTFTDQVLDTLLHTAIQNRPELLGAVDHRQARQELLHAAKSLHFGSFTAVGVAALTQYGDVHEGGIPKDGFAPFWGAGATARVPIFTGFRIQNEIREAGHHLGESEHELKNVANEVGLQVTRAYLAIIGNAQQIPLEDQRVALARESLQLAEERYRVGLSSILDVIQAATLLFESESRFIEAQYLYQISQAALAHATGSDYKTYE